MLAIHAEMTDGHEDLILMAVGPAHECAAAGKRLELLTPLFEKSNPPGALVTPLNWPTVVQLATEFGPAWCPSPRLVEWIGDQVMRRTSTGEIALSYTPPAGLEPYPWQVAGAQIISALSGAIIMDEPGTGKTITAILGLVELLYRSESGPVIVVCPASVVDSWVAAWQNWAPHVRTVAWRGPKRKALADTADVYVMSYEIARIDTPTSSKPQTLLKLKPAHLVVDESHLIKNPRAERTKAVHRIARAVNKQRGASLMMSGTPITHHPGDLWPSLYAMEPDAYPAGSRWSKRYCITIDTEDRVEVLGLEPLRDAEFRLTMLGQERRIAKADALPFLPPKVYSQRTVDMPKAWRKVYDDFAGQMLAELPDGTELQVMDVMSKLGHLSRLACAAADVEVTHGPDLDPITQLPKRHVRLELKAPSWKVDALLEILAERPGEPVVAFAPSRQLMVLAGETAVEKGLRVGYIIGGQTAAQRTATVTAFQAGELDLLCVTTGAGGVGITLTAAKTCVFLQRPWSLVESIQAEDRCHRIGSEQHDSIEVIDIVTRDSLDTQIHGVLRERANQLAELVQDPRVVTELLGGSPTPERKTA